MKKTILLTMVLLLIAGCSNNNIIGETIKEENIKIPLSDLSSEANFYEYDYNGVIIRYFVVLGSDGEPRTAFDACDVCGGSKGYEQIGNDIKCRNCGRVFSIDGLGTKNTGYGCWPSYLEHEQDGDNIFIKVSDIKAGKHRFV